MQIKIPAAYDFSHYVEIADFANITPRPLFAYTKATEGETIVDAKFKRYWLNMQKNSIARGAFHFFRKALNPIKQADKFLAIVKDGGVQDNDKLIFDIEELGTSAAQIITWLDRIELSLGNQILIYSRANILNPIAATAAQIQRLKQYPIITAGYPDDPDEFDEVPIAYIPDQSKWGKVAGWQYAERTAESTAITGVIGKVDFNWLAPWFIETLQPATPDSDPVAEAIRYAGDIIAAAIRSLKTTTPTEPGTEPPTTPDDGYTGTFIGTYRVKDNGLGGWIGAQDSWGAEETVLMDETQKWLDINCPGWDELIKNGVAWRAGILWHIKLRVYRGQIVRVAQIAMGRAQIIGIDAAGDPALCATNLNATGKDITPWYFHKITNVPRWHPIVQPRTVRNVPGAMWIPIELLEKV